MMLAFPPPDSYSVLLHVTFASWLNASVATPESQESSVHARKDRWATSSKYLNGMWMLESRCRLKPTQAPAQKSGVPVVLQPVISSRGQSPTQVVLRQNASAEDAG